MTDDQPSADRYPHTPSHGVPTGPLACIILAVAVSVLGVTLAVAQADGIIDVPKGVFSLIGAAISLTGGGGMALTAVAGVQHRLDRLERYLAQQREEAYAEGYVAATAGRPHLTAVNQR